MPKLELWQPSDEGAELFVLLGWKSGLAAGAAIFEGFILSQGGVEFGLEEGEEEV